MYDIISCHYTRRKVDFSGIWTVQWYVNEASSKLLTLGFLSWSHCEQSVRSILVFQVSLLLRLYSDVPKLFWFPLAQQTLCQSQVDFGLSPPTVTSLAEDSLLLLTLCECSLDVIARRKVLLQCLGERGHARKWRDSLSFCLRQSSNRYTYTVNLQPAAF